MLDKLLGYIVGGVVVGASLALVWWLLRWLGAPWWVFFMALALALLVVSWLRDEGGRTRGRDHKGDGGDLKPLRTVPPRSMANVRRRRRLVRRLAGKGLPTSEIWDRVRRAGWECELRTIQRDLELEGGQQDDAGGVA
jgi:hypothetical protein